MKIKLSLLALIFCFKFNFAQEIQLKIEKEESSIKYKGDHLLHSWEGINNNVNGIAILNSKSNKIEKIAILIYVRDFDSGNPGRDAHSLEVLEALKYPEIRFYSESIKIVEDNVNFKGTFNFHGIKIEKELVGNMNRKNDIWKISGNFKLVPSDFGIKLPSFLSVKMKNLLDIDYSIALK
ncbi:MAG: YceI family protein [Flavobacteriaceae bacterium]|nr:YceI family protein [Flavobacteriaceae bacterium]MDG2235039.1 YceI family protein [Flavobacteriaceae bacterium]|tara:strand:+ start:4141 stop:4680 length:540 start_codon:yes stop_codon:yes gene_type:complete